MTPKKEKARLVGMDMVSCSKGWYRHLWRRYQTSVQETQACKAICPSETVVWLVGGCSFPSAVTGALPALLRSYRSVASVKEGARELKILNLFLV